MRSSGLDYASRRNAKQRKAGSVPPVCSQNDSDCSRSESNLEPALRAARGQYRSTNQDEPLNLHEAFLELKTHQELFGQDRSGSWRGWPPPSNSTRKDAASKPLCRKGIASLVVRVHERCRANTALILPIFDVVSFPSKARSSSRFTTGRWRASVGFLLLLRKDSACHEGRRPPASVFIDLWHQLCGRTSNSLQMMRSSLTSVIVKSIEILPASQ
jgi:hypothetical protein